MSASGSRPSVQLVCVRRSPFTAATATSVAWGGDPFDPGGGDYLRPDRRAGSRSDADGDVAGRLAVARQAPRDDDALEAGPLLQVRDHLARGRARLVKEGSAGALPERGDRLQDVLFGLRLDLRELLEPVVASGLLELLDGRDAEVVVDHACGRGADTWDAKEREQTRRHRRLQVGVTLRDSGRDELLDRLGDRRPDLGDLLEAFFIDELR